jgi:hypothetical protein
MRRGRTLTILEVSDSSKRVLVRVAKVLLGGVGQIPSSVEAMALAIHYRRALTEAEYARLPESWCAIPPVHKAGRGVVLEENT